MSTGILSARMSAHLMRAVQKPEEGRAPLRLEAEVAVSYPVGAGYGIQVLWERTQCS